MRIFIFFFRFFVVFLYKRKKKKKPNPPSESLPMFNPLFPALDPFLIKVTSEPGEFYTNSSCFFFCSFCFSKRKKNIIKSKIEKKKYTKNSRRASETRKVIHVFAERQKFLSRVYVLFHRRKKKKDR